MEIFNKFQDKITKLVKLLDQEQVDAYLISSKDEFQNEHPPIHNRRLEWLSSFSGSSGYLLVTKSSNYLFLDSRYRSGIGQSYKDFIILDLYCVKTVKTPILEKNIVIGFDPKIITIAEIEIWRQNLHCKFIPLSTNLVDRIWTRSLEYRTQSPTILDSKYTSKSVQNKLDQIMKQMTQDYLLLTNPESICWLLNIRGRDLPYTPSIMCYCIIDKNGDIELFSFLKRIDHDYKKITLFPFQNHQDRFLEITKNGFSIQADPNETPVWFLQQNPQLSLVMNPCFISQSEKDEVELSGIDLAHRKDGVSLTILYKWLQNNINQVDELQVVSTLNQLKKRSTCFLSESFPTIAAVGSNSAIIHYSPTDNTNVSLTTKKIFLLDSGSQYKFGTTDVTRTFHFGIPTEEERYQYTLVLKSLIKLSMICFPVGTKGSQIDAIGREILWKNGYDYPHATGHSVGYSLSVHDQSVIIGKNSNTCITVGMVIALEPGLYIPNKYGFRLENMYVVKKASISGFLRFEILTKVPFDINMIDQKILDHQESVWLDQYYRLIKKELCPFLKESDREFLYKQHELLRKTIAIDPD